MTCIFHFKQGIRLKLCSTSSIHKRLFLKAYYKIYLISSSEDFRYMMCLQIFMNYQIWYLAPSDTNFGYKLSVYSKQYESYWILSVKKPLDVLSLLIFYIKYHSCEVKKSLLFSFTLPISCRKPWLFLQVFKNFNNT